MSLRNLRVELSNKIQDITDDIDSLESLSDVHEKLNFDPQIVILREKKVGLIETQDYLAKCEFELGNTINRWLENGCKGKIKISLTGEKKNEHKNNKKDASTHN